MRIETPLLVVGRGPGALVVAKLAGRRGLPCLLAGHDAVGGLEPVALDAAAVAVLEDHGLLDVLRPYLAGRDPITIAPADFEDVVKHHCVADLNVTVYDGVSVVESVLVDGGVRGVLTDGTSRWDLHAERFVDAADLPPAVPAAIVAGAAVVESVLAR